MTKKKKPSEYATRVAELAKIDPQVAAHIPREDLWETLQDDALPLAERIDTLLAGYGERPALAERKYKLEEKDGITTRHYSEGFSPISYSELRRRICAIAAAWSHQDKFNVDVDDRVCMMGFTGIDFFTLDTACIFAQAVSVPLQANTGFDTLKAICETVEPTVLATRCADLKMAVRLAENLPSLRSLIVFDYDASDEANKAAWDEARAALEESSAKIAAISLGELISLGSTKDWELLPPHSEGTERLTAIVHSSGSTGTPKGAMLPERAVSKAWHIMLPNAPTISVGYAPLNHLMARLSLQGTLGIGGRINFTLAEDMSSLIADTRNTRPIFLSFIPRVIDLIYQDYLNHVWQRVNDAGVSESQAREDILEEFRGTYLGDRLIAATVGSAPTTKEMRHFINDCFGIRLANGYGNTESGTGMVTMNGRIARHSVTDYRLRDVPELGYFTSDKPHPRGELLIKTKTQILGYYKNPEATAKLIDEDGFYATGDIVEETKPDYVQIIDRVNDVLKLSQGEYVAVGRLGTIFESESDLIEQIYIYGNSLRSYLLAVVVPEMSTVTDILGASSTTAAITALIREDLQKVGRSADLKSFEIPRDFILESEHFSSENGLLTSVLKKKRPALKVKYGEQLEAIYENAEALKSEQLKLLKDSDSPLSIEEKLRLLLASNLGVEEDEIDSQKSYQDHGGDSLGSVSLSLAILDVFGLDIPSNDILSPAGGISAWVKILEGGNDRLATYEDIHGTNTEEVLAKDLTLNAFLSAELLAQAASLPDVDASARQTILLTGANGFLGRFVCLEWLEELSSTGGKLICLIRAADDAAAADRLLTAFSDASDHMRATYESYSDSIEVIAGDFGQSRLGLTTDKFEELAEKVDLISHVGALVNHVMDYKSLFAPNVAGVAELIKLALSGKKKSFDFVSSVGVTPHLKFNTGGAETAKLKDFARLSDQYANGYGASKWAGEVLLGEAQTRFGLPLRILRGDMMLTHRDLAGQINTDDMFTRILYSVIKTELAPKSFHDSNPDGSRALVPYAGTPVNIVAQSVVKAGQHFTEQATVFCLDNPQTELSNSLDAFVDWIMEAGYKIQRLEAHEDWISRFRGRLTALPETEKKQSAIALLKAFEQPMPFVPFRSESTNFQTLLGKMGVTKNEMQLDADFIYKCLQDMAWHGMIAPPKTKPKLSKPNNPKTKSTSAFGVTSKSSDVVPMDIERRLPGDNDVAIDIEFCGVCHSDIHFAHNDWGITQYPLVPGHEIIGRVVGIGESVTDVKVGTRVAVGCLVDSCRKCSSCDDGLEQYCDGGQVMTYNSYDHRHDNTLTFGGYSEHIVVDKDFVMTVPETLNPAGAAPLLCAGITTWSPLREWDIKAGMRVGIVGLGGLGHMALKFSAALGAETVLITRSKAKAEDAKRLGASEVLVSKDITAMREAKGSFDFILDTIPVQHNVDDYVRLLKRDGTLCMVGALEPLDFHAGRLAMQRKKIVGSSMGSIKETREMLEFCGEHNITSDVEIITSDNINQAWNRVKKSDVKYRFVIDMKA